MRFLGFLFIVALALGAWGYHKGWFTVSSTDDGDKSKVTFALDKAKLNQDLEIYRSRIQQKFDELKQKTNDLKTRATATDAKVRSEAEKRADEAERQIKLIGEKLRDMKDVTADKLKELEKELDAAIEKAKKGGS